MSDRRETAISVKMALERATDGNGAGNLLMQLYVEEASWYSFTDNERWIMEKAIRRFRRELQAAGFLPDRRTGRTVIVASKGTTEAVYGTKKKGDAEPGISEGERSRGGKIGFHAIHRDRP